MRCNNWKYYKKRRQYFYFTFIEYNNNIKKSGRLKNSDTRTENNGII